MSDNVKLNEAVARIRRVNRGENTAAVYPQCDERQYLSIDICLVADAALQMLSTEPVTEEALRAMGCVFEERLKPLVNGWLIPGATDPSIRLVPDGDKYIVEARSPHSEWHESVGICDVRTMGQLRCGLRFLGITIPGEQP